MKKLVALLLAGVMTLSLAACGNQSSKSEDKKETSKSEETVEISFWHAMSGANEEAIQKITDDFMKENPNIKVNLMNQGDYLDLFDKLMASAKAKQLPNLAQIYSNRLSWYVDKGLALDITPYINDPKIGLTDEDKADFVNSSMTQNTYDGKLYAVGATESSVAFYYNKDYLKECGVDTDDLDSRTLENPLTTDEVAEIAEKCTTDDYVGTHIIMDHGEGLPYALEPLYLSAGKDYISEDGKEADGYVNSEEAVNTTSWLADLIAKGYANVEPITDEFLNGACATMLGGSWEIATLEQNADFDWGVTYYPVNAETKKAVSPCGDWSAAISKDCENADAAGEFLAWLMNTDNVATYAAAIAKPATRSSAYETEAMTEYKEGARALIVDQLENTAVPRPRTPSYATFSSAYAEAMTNIFSDAASNEEVDTDYVQSELDTAVDTFTEDYETYYAE